MEGELIIRRMVLKVFIVGKKAKPLIREPGSKIKEMARG